MMEEWRDIEGFDGYQVSNIGRVKTLNYNRTGEERILQTVEGGKKYLVLTLCKDGKKYNRKVHRLVAEAFIPNPDNKPQIDHINTDRTDNRVENLRWVTPKENINNPLTIVKLSENAKRCENAKGCELGKIRSISVKQYSKDGVLLETYPSAAEAERQTGVYHSSITACCKNKQKSAGSYLWRYAS